MPACRSPLLLAGLLWCAGWLAVARGQEEGMTKATTTTTTTTTNSGSSSTSTATSVDWSDLDDSEAKRECFKFLMDNMPMADRHDDAVGDALLTATVELALRARRAHDWAGAVPWDIFLNDVLPYAVVNEPRDAWRPLFSTVLPALVADAGSLTDAAQLLNKNVWALWNITYVPDQTPLTMSPLTTIAHGNASCTGLSIFLVQACRSVGVPARIAGTPHWNRGPDACPDGDQSELCGNHNWVEVWDGGRWSFVGAHEYDEMNRTWFFPSPAKLQTPGGTNHSIFVTSWRRGGTHFPLTWAWTDTSVPAVDVTRHYLDAHAPQQ